jgi:hypothetical protein
MPPSKRRIDHIVHAVHDLDAAAEAYARLGFQVGARNRHPWGTENRIVQFRSSFVELITLGDRPGDIPPHGPGRFSFGAFVRDYLAEREGVAMLVLDSADARADAARFAEAGIGRFEPFDFAREGRGPDGGEVEVAFTLAFALDPSLPSAGFFVCQQHFPEHFWNPAFQRHPNGATDVRVATLAAPEPAAHADFLSAFAGASAEQTTGGLAFPLEGGDLRVEPGAGGFVSYTVSLPDAGHQARLLAEEGTPHETIDGALRAEVHGVDIIFR